MGSDEATVFDAPLAPAARAELQWIRTQALVRV